MVDEDTILDVLNSDCWSHIFSYVSIEHLIRSERVSKQWRDVVTEYFGRNSRRTFNTSWGPGMTLNQLVQLLRRRGAAFTKLKLEDEKILDTSHSSPEDFDSSICPNLEDLKINAQCSKSYFIPFLNSKKLKSIYLTSNNGDVADHLLKQSVVNDDFSLERLTLISDRSSGQFLVDNIDKLQNIKYLAFHKCCDFNKNILISIKEFHYLTTLKMESCSFGMLQTVILKILSSLTQLQELSLCGYYSMANFDPRIDITETQFSEALTKLNLLKRLNICKNMFVTNDVMKQIAQTCKHLESLDVSYCVFVGDEGVIAVCRSCENLKELNVSGLRNPGTHESRAIKAVSHLFKLERLTANGFWIPNITAAFAACLLACPALTELDACSSDVTSELVEAAVAALELHPRPLLLRLYNTHVIITDELPKHRLLTVLARSEW